MERYVPRLPNGHAVPLSWPLKVFRFHHIFWPLESNASKWNRRLDYLLAILGCLIFLQHNDAELRYLRLQFQNIDKLLSGVPTYLVLLESHLRGLHVMLHRKQMLQLMQHFYAHIYVEEASEKQHFQAIRRAMRLSRLMAMMYFCALSGFLFIPILCLINRRKEYLYPMVLPFDDSSMYIYVPLIVSSIWVGSIIAVLIFGEINLLGEMMMHLDARYSLLQRDLRHSVTQILEGRQRPHMARQMRLVITDVLRRNVALNKFAQEIENAHNMRIFIIFSFSTGLLCALCFKAYTNPAANYTYAVWFVSKTVDLMAIGQIGSILAHTTDKLNSMYYESKWEDVIFHSTNTIENIYLMKLIVIAIELNSRPFYVTGLKYFRVSVVAVMQILKGAFSYFTFLTSIR